MTAQETADPDDTVVSGRVAEAGSAPTDDSDSDGDSTVVVGRDARDGDESTVLVARSASGGIDGDDDDSTVLVARPAPEDVVDDDSDPTAQVRRDDDDATVQVRRDDDDATVQMRRDDDPTAQVRRDDDATRISAPGREQSPVTTKPVSAAVKPVMSAPKKRRRGELHPAPVPAGYGERAVRGSGVGAVSTYRARTIPLPPAMPSRLVASQEVHRITEGAPSVTRESRRFAVLVLAGFGASCVISIVGLVLIARAAFAL